MMMKFFILTQIKCIINNESLVNFVKSMTLKLSQHYSFLYKLKWTKQFLFRLNSFTEKFIDIFRLINQIFI